MLESKGLLSIGWAAFGACSDFVAKHQDDWASVSETIAREWGPKRARFGLQRFLEMAPGQVIKERCANDILDVIKEKLNPDAFERLIADYFERQGASVRIPPKNERDKQGDADVEATFDHLRVIIYVQAKHHEGETNEWAVEQIEKYVEHRKLGERDGHYDHVAWVVSTATYTEDCRRRVESERAESAGAIQLVTGQEFAEMLLDVGIEAVGRLR